MNKLSKIMKEIYLTEGAVPSGYVIELAKQVEFLSLRVTGQEFMIKHLEAVVSGLDRNQLRFVTLEEMKNAADDARLL